MTRILIGLFALTLAFFVASPAASAVADDTHDHDHQVLRGKIAKISHDSHAFVLVGKDKDHKVLVKVTKKTKIFVNGHAAEFGDLEVGMRARVAGKFHANDKGDKGFLAFRVRAKSGD